MDGLVDSFENVGSEGVPNCDELKEFISFVLRLVTQRKKFRTNFVKLKARA